MTLWLRGNEYEKVVLQLLSYQTHLKKRMVVFNQLLLLGELRKKTLQKCGSVAQERRGAFHAYGFD